MHLESKWLSMVHIDPGAGGIVYVQPQQRMVPSTLPLPFLKKNSNFFSSQVSIQKGSSESFFGPTKGVPQDGFIFVTLCKVFPRPRIFLETSKISKAPNMDPHNTSLAFPQPNKNKNS